MPILRRVLLAALFAGVLSGVLAAALHQFATVPLILEAEKYEHVATPAAGHAEGHAGSRVVPAPSALAHSHGEAWAPETGLERAAYTLAADLLAGIGFALLITSGMALRGDEVAWREGLFWGLAGFVAFTIAPGLGLPPDIPGTEAGPLPARQLWWVTTAGMTAGALALLAFTRGKLTAAAAVVLLALPHLYGAPLPHSDAAAAPPALARQFVVTATVANFLFWAALGAATGYFYSRFGRRAA
jgi:cobalt transporter subunit CbtA